MVSVIHRRLKDNHSTEEFIDAFLPESCNRSGSKEEITSQFIDYWKSHGPVAGGAILQARSLHDPSEVITIGLTDISLKDFEGMLESAMKSEQERGDKQDEISDKIGEAKLYQMFHTIP